MLQKPDFSTKFSSTMFHMQCIIFPEKTLFVDRVKRYFHFNYYFKTNSVSSFVLENLNIIIFSLTLSREHCHN